MDRIDVLLFSALIGTTFSVLTYLFTSQIGEWKNRKNISLLGEIVLEGLQEEIRTGIGLMNDLQRWANGTGHDILQPRLLPTASWDGMNTISDDIMLRIIATSPPHIANKLRCDCKNYFAHICTNINYTLSRQREIASLLAKDILKYLSSADKGNYLVASQNLYDDIEKIKDTLKNNANKLFPA